MLVARSDRSRCSLTARPLHAGKAEGTKYTSEQLPDGVVTKGGSSWTKDWLKFDNSYFTEVRYRQGSPA